METLPLIPDVWSYIFSYITDIHDVISIRLVCRTFRTLCQQSITGLSPINMGTEKVWRGRRKVDKRPPKLLLNINFVALFTKLTRCELPVYCNEISVLTSADDTVLPSNLSRLFRCGKLDLTCPAGGEGIIWYQCR